MDWRYYYIARERNRDAVREAERARRLRLIMGTRTSRRDQIVARVLAYSGGFLVALGNSLQARAASRRLASRHT